ncbi:hypothetical protein Tco_1011408 [Tanacetum coccineum]
MISASLYLCTKYATSLTKPKAARYDLEGIEAMIPQLWSSTKIRYVGLDNKEPYTIFYEPKGVVYLNKDDKKYLMRLDKVYMIVMEHLKRLDWKRSEADCFHVGEDRKDVADKKDYEEFKVFCGWKKDRDGLQTSYADRMTCHSQVC